MCMAAGLGIIGGLVQGIGAYSSQMTQAAQYNAQSKALTKQAQGERNVGAYESARAQEKGDRVVSQQVTGMAAKGLDINSGTPLDVIQDSSTEVALDVGTIRSNFQTQSNKTDYEAKIAKMNYKSAKAAAPLAFLAPVIGGVGGAFG